MPNEQPVQATTAEALRMMPVAAERIGRALDAAQREASSFYSRAETAEIVAAFLREMGGMVSGAGFMAGPRLAEAVREVARG